MKTDTRAFLLILLSSCTGARAADTGLTVYRAMGIAATDVMNGTVLTAQVLPGAEKQVVALVTFLTGKRDEAGAVGIRLEVFRRSGEDLETVYSRDYAKENGGSVGRGELELVDLNGDGVNEIVVTYENAKDRLVQERDAEVLLRESSGFRVAWSGAMEYDATRAARETPGDRRDRFVRKIDVPRTLKTRGVSLILAKTTIAVAGERLAEPKVTSEAFPLRPPDDVR